VKWEVGYEKNIYFNYSYSCYGMLWNI
jgi:hypothetical protein